MQVMKRVPVNHEGARLLWMLLLEAWRSLLCAEDAEDDEDDEDDGQGSGSGT